MSRVIKIKGLIVEDISSIISLLTKIDPIKACSASIQGCLLFGTF